MISAIIILVLLGLMDLMLFVACFELSKSYYELSSQRLGAVEAQMTITDLLGDWRFP